jgi:hypothetical protein
MRPSLGVDGVAACDLTTVEVAGTAFKAQGYRATAADAWAVAGVLAARHGVASAPREHAAAVYRGMALHPLLGSLLEARSLAQVQVAVNQV